MRGLTQGLEAQILPGQVASLASCWILTRKDGVTSGFTDHDQPVTLNGVVCQASTGLNSHNAAIELGAKPGAAKISGLLNAGSLTEADIATGLYDQAMIEAWRVDFTAPLTNHLLLWRGQIASLSRQGHGFVAEIAGPIARLDIVAGRTYQRNCDAVLGDSRCQVNLNLPNNQGAVCDKSWEMCQGSFNNLINFQGFPDIPGDDFLTAYATDNPNNTGGSRRS